MFRVAVLLAFFTISTAQADPAGPRIPTRQFGLSQHFVVVNGTLDWIAPAEAPPVTAMAKDFWTLFEMVAPIGATLLDNQRLTVQGPPPGLTIPLRVLHVPTRTVVCDAPLLLTAAAARVLTALGCVARTDAENQQLQDEALHAIRLHLLTLTPGVQS